jgi:hypothetical protein
VLRPAQLPSQVLRWQLMLQLLLLVMLMLLVTAE